MQNFIRMMVVIVVMIFVLGCSSNSVRVKDATLKQYITKNEKVIIYQEDIVGDDNGPGTYIYPTREDFKKGDFDLVSFMVTETEKTYNFYFKIKNDFSNKWGLPLGWDVQMFDVYLNFGENKHKHTLGGRNVKIRDGWDYVLVVAGETKPRMTKEINNSKVVKDDITPAEDVTERGFLPDIVRTFDNVLIATVNKTDKFNMDNLKGYQVFVLGSDGYAMETHTFSRLVIEQEDIWKFSGGSDYQGDPNVIDILGDNSSLGNYISTRDRTEYTEINLIKIKK